MGSYWVRFQQLSPAERALLFRVTAAVPAVAASLRWRGLKATADWLNRQPTLTRYTTSDQHLSAERIAAIVDIVARRHPAYRATCLPQSLVLWQSLRRYSYPAQLKIGVSRENDRIIGHAWVELDGQVLNDSPHVAQRFQQVDLSSPARFSLL